MSSCLFSICFETDTTIFSTSIKDTKDTKDAKDSILLDDPENTGASGGNLPNKDAFTISNILNLKTQIIPSNMTDDLHEEYKINFPNIKLWDYDIHNSIIIDDIEKVICIILFINGVYGLHYICNIDTFETKKQDLQNLVHKISFDQNFSQKNEYILLINTFNINGKIQTSNYENIFISF